MAGLDIYSTYDEQGKRRMQYKRRFFEQRETTKVSTSRYLSFRCNKVRTEIKEARAQRLHAVYEPGFN